MTITPPIEGHFIVTDEKLIFEVKGIVHPEGRVIAYLRYVPDRQGERSNREGERYRKIYSLEEREVYLKENYPVHLWNSKMHGRVVQSVPIENIAFSLDPVDALRQLRDMGGHVSPIQEATCNLAEILVQKSGIEWGNIGVTGSQLVGLELTQSDIDLVVFGEDAARKLHACLISSDAVLEFSSYQGELLEKHLQFRWSRHNGILHKLREIEARKAFQGIFRNWEVFVRAVKYPSEVVWKYNDYTFRGETERVVKGRVLDDSDSIFTPCYYAIDCEELPTLRYLTSYRGRFAEHVRKGMEVKAKGRLETVKNTKTQDEYTQIVLGEKTTDYLVPI